MKKSKLLLLPVLSLLVLTSCNNPQASNDSSEASSSNTVSSSETVSSESSNAVSSSETVSSESSNVVSSSETVSSESSQQQIDVAAIIANAQKGLTFEGIFNIHHTTNYNTGEDNKPYESDDRYSTKAVFTEGKYFAYETDSSGSVTLDSIVYERGDGLAYSDVLNLDNTIYSYPYVSPMNGKYVTFNSESSYFVNPFNFINESNITYEDGKYIIGGKTAGQNNAAELFFTTLAGYVITTSFISSIYFTVDANNNIDHFNFESKSINNTYFDRKDVYTLDLAVSNVGTSEINLISTSPRLDTEASTKIDSALEFMAEQNYTFTYTDSYKKAQTNEDASETAVVKVNPNAIYSSDNDVLSSYCYRDSDGVSTFVYDEANDRIQQLDSYGNYLSFSEFLPSFEFSPDLLTPNADGSYGINPLVEKRVLTNLTSYEDSLNLFVKAGTSKLVFAENAEEDTYLASFEFEYNLWGVNGKVKYEFKDVGDTDINLNFNNMYVNETYWSDDIDSQIREITSGTADLPYVASETKNGWSSNNLRDSDGNIIGISIGAYYENPTTYEADFEALNKVKANLIAAYDEDTNWTSQGTADRTVYGEVFEAQKYTCGDFAVYIYNNTYGGLYIDLFPASHAA